MLHSSRALNQQRRRRVLLERSQGETSLVDALVEPAESPMTRGQRKNSAAEEPATSPPSLYFSRAVRSAYSLRVMQLLPLAPLSLAASICLASSLLAGLLAAHYIVHRSPPTEVETASLSRLLHIRSPQGLAQWLSIQLWLLLAALTLLIYQMRRYTLDDYQARYRQWPLIALGCGLMSLERSSGALSLVGEGIDVWCSSYLGLPGWVCVRLAAAGLAAFICLRLCSDLLEFPSSLTPWLLGWLAWGLSGLLASGLLRLEIDRLYRDMLIGGGYLLGLLSVTLAATLYLRRNYQLAALQLAKRGAVSGRLSTPPLTSADGASPAPTTRKRSDRHQATAEAITGATAGATSRWGWVRRASSDPNSAAEKITNKRASQSPDIETDTPGTTCSDRQQAWNGWFQKSPPSAKAAPSTQPTPNRSAAANDQPHETTATTTANTTANTNPRPPRASLSKLGKTLLRLALPIPAIPRLLRGRLPKLSIPPVGTPKVKLPKLKLPQMRLLPPEPSQPASTPKVSQNKSLSPNGSGRSATPPAAGSSASPNDRLDSLRGRGSSFQSAPAPGGPNASSFASSPQPASDELTDSPTDRPLSRSERKALRRAARQGRDAA